MKVFPCPSALFAILLVALLSACSRTPQNSTHDPLEKPNRVFYKVNDNLDRFIMRPISKVYTHVFPAFVRKRVNNFFSNLGEPNNCINDLLQGKPKASASDVGRFATNSTVGLAGMFDVASHWHMERHEEDFGQTFAVWGIPDGPYLVIPLVGPSTCRDAPGQAMSALLRGAFFLGASFAIQRTIDLLETVDKRATAEAQLKAVNQTAVDRYVFIREGYRQHRAFLIYDGNPPLPEDLDMESPEDKSTSPADTPSTPPSDASPPASLHSSPPEAAPTPSAPPAPEPSASPKP